MRLLGLGFSLFIPFHCLPISSIFLAASTPPLMLIPWTCNLSTNVAFAHVLYFSLLDANLTYPSGLQTAYCLLWEASIDTTLQSYAPRYKNLLKMQQDFWRGLHSYKNPDSHETNDTIAFMIYPLPPVLSHMFFESMIGCQTCMWIPVPSALPRIQ